MTQSFVTGGSGFIGSRLIERLVAEGHTVCALARSPQSAERVAALGAEPAMGDLDDVESMAAGAAGCEWAFHLAAHLGEWGRREDFERGNVQGTANALAACARAGVSRFIHVGTEAALMAGQPLVQVDESAPLRPDSPALYSSTKARAERLVAAANRDGFETLAVRPRFVWGKGDTTLLPAISEMVRAGRFAWIGGGRHLTSIAHVANVVEGLLLAAANGRPGNAYFVTDDDTVVFRDFLSEMLATQGIAPPTRSVPVPLAAVLSRIGEAAWGALPLPGQPPVSRFAYWVSSQECTIRIDKAKRELAYRPVVTREQGLAELRSG